MEIIDKLAWIEIQNKSILSTRSKGKYTFYIPGGKRERGELDSEALIREVKEELSVDLIKDTIKFVGIFKAQAHGKADGVVVQMSCYKSEFRGVLTPDSEIEEMRWLKYQDLEIISPVDKIIFKWLKDRDLIE